MMCIFETHLDPSFPDDPRLNDSFNDSLVTFDQLHSEIISWNPSFILITGDYNVRTSS